MALYKFTGAQQFREIEKDTIVLLNEAFCCTKGLCEMKNVPREVSVSYFFRTEN